MSLISPSQAQDGVTGVNAASINNPINTIANDYNGNITDANISASAAIAFSKVAGGSATALVAWQSYVPTLTSLSGGTLNYAKYVQVGKTVFVRFKYTLAGAGVGTGPGISLPVTANSDYTGTETGETYLGTVSLIDTGISFYVGAVMQLSTTTVRFRYMNSNPLSMGAITSTLPFTWGANDYIQCHFCYEAA